MAEFRMPMLGADMEAGTLIEWMKHPGDAVHRGDIIAVVDTQKGAIEVEAFDEGVLGRLLVQPGERVPVGTVMAEIQGQETGTSVPTGPRVAPPEVRPAVSVVESAAERPPAARSTTRPKASPAARQAARRLGVDLTQMTGTGRDGAITIADVERAAAAGAQPPAKVKLEPPAPPVTAVAAKPAAPQAADRSSAMRAAIAAAMARSKREIPHFYLSTTIDMSRTEAWLAAENLRRPVPERILGVVPLLKAVALALTEVPELNGFFSDGAYRPGSGIHVGCAIALRGGGLVAPAVHDVVSKSLSVLMSELRDLVSRARSGSLRSSELADSTITVTNLGDTGVESTFGIIFPPQVALVGFGKVVRRPWVTGDAIAIRPTVVATLAADHRVIDGHRGGLFLAAVDRRLQTPEAL